MWVLEQFHGPTCAFKDHALQLLGKLFALLLARGGAGQQRRMTVLGATSGDTGSAAIAGLRGQPGVSVVILHPAGGVAPMQVCLCSVRAGVVRRRGAPLNALSSACATMLLPLPLWLQALQMTTVLDPNVHNIAVGGGATFDDCQAIVKAAFGHESFRHKYNLSAINRCGERGHLLLVAFKWTLALPLRTPLLLLSPPITA